ncbi:MAG TPA: PPC domain-containing protein, partial [Blastocatellia bacterium]|nr:PPC domain-containing protein [Blastocatellia bacterium]
MYRRSFRRAVSTTAAALLLAAPFVGAQDVEPKLKITRPQIPRKENDRVIPPTEMDKDSAFHRVAPRRAEVQVSRTRRRQSIAEERVSAFVRSGKVAAAVSTQSFGTGGGDIFEQEPNNSVAQGVSLPLNIFGEVSFQGDVDFFSFQSLAGQQVTIEPFAARIRNSDLIADIALFDATGRLLDADFGDEDDDPIIRFTSQRDEVLIVGITDIDDFGGPSFDYLLNITRGIDVEEAEPNQERAQSLPDLPLTLFGVIETRRDVDFYSFVASAGQTLILDIDAEVLGSRLDAEFNLLDPESGVEFFYNDQNDGDDPRFNIVLPYTGRYVIGVGAFNENSRGFYRLNASLVSSDGAPVLGSIIRLSGKKFDVTGAGFRSGTVVEVNGRPRKT